MSEGVAQAGMGVDAGDVDIYPQVDPAPAFHETYRQRPFLLRNDKGRLVEVTRSAGPGMQLAVSARSATVGGDDGDPDLLVTAIDSRPLLLRNDTPRTGQWVKLRVFNRHGSPAIGARVILSSGGKSQTRELRSGSSYQSQNALELLFGLGLSAKIDSLGVFLPVGRRSSSRDLAADRTITLRELAEARSAATR